MKWKILLCLFLACLIKSFGQEPASVKVHPLITEYWSYDDTLSCMLIFRNQNGPASIPIEAGKVEKSMQVYHQLSSLAKQSQTVIVDSLEVWNVPYRTFYIVNAIQARLDSSTLRKLIQSPDLQSILPDFSLTTPSEPLSPGHVRRLDTLIHWGIHQIQADRVWGMGITGQGVVVAGLDTGIEWDHDFLRKNYGGNQSDGSVNHSYSWYDAIDQINGLNHDDTITISTNPCGLKSSVPCDDDGHGTFTMGLMTGVFDNQHTGIAPGATWIGARVMERAYGHLSTYLAGLEWCLAPTDINGQFPLPERAPDIINNSWACPQKEGCFPENYWLLDSAVSRLTEAGIFVISSAGNEGRNGCSSLKNPLAIFPSVFTVGATGINDSITAFSSRGPVESSAVIKPEVVAPGSGITSIYPGGQFQKSSGTSISAPITAGVAALLLEANPALRGHPDVLREILTKTAVPIMTNPCGPDEHPNSVYGYGRINALDAVQMALEYQPSSLPEHLAEQAILMYPNPVDQFLYFKSKIDAPGLLVIYDVQGRPVKKLALQSRTEMEINISDLNSGLYFVHFKTREGITVRKFLKI